MKGGRAWWLGRGALDLLLQITAMPTAGVQVGSGGEIPGEEEQGRNLGCREEESHF